MFRMQERQTLGSTQTKFGPILDTWVMYRKRFPELPGKLTTACEALGIELSNAHNAHADSQASLELALKLREIPEADNLNDSEVEPSKIGYINDGAEGLIFKITRTVNGKPAALKVCSPFDGQWTSVSTAGGRGAAVLDRIESSSPRDLEVPRNIAGAYGHVSGSCLMCGKPLSDPQSVSRGYGRDCRSKLAD